MSRGHGKVGAVVIPIHNRAARSPEGSGFPSSVSTKLSERWFSWSPAGLEHQARIRYAPHEEPHAVWVHVQIQAGGRTYEAQFPFQREQLRTMRQKADDFMVAEFRKSLAREMTPPPSVTKA